MDLCSVLRFERMISLNSPIVEWPRLARCCRSQAFAPTSANHPLATVRRRKRQNGRKVGHCGSNCSQAKTSILTHFGSRSVRNQHGIERLPAPDLRRSRKTLTGDVGLYLEIRKRVLHPVTALDTKTGRSYCLNDDKVSVLSGIILAI
jgi:hypothetical protein